MAPRKKRAAASSSQVEAGTDFRKSRRTATHSSREISRGLNNSEMDAILEDPNAHGFDPNHPLLNVMRKLRSEEHRLQMQPKAFYVYQLNRYRKFDDMRNELDEIVKTAPHPDSQRLKETITGYKSKAVQGVTRKYNLDHLRMTFDEDDEKFGEMRDIFFPKPKLNKNKNYLSFEDLVALEMECRHSDPDSPTYNILKDIVKYPSGQKLSDVDEECVEDFAMRSSSLRGSLALCEAALQNEPDNSMLGKIKSGIMRLLYELRGRFEKRIPATKLQEMIDNDDDLKGKGDIDEYLERLLNRLVDTPDSDISNTKIFMDLIDKVAMYSYVLQEEYNSTKKGIREKNNKALEECENEEILDLHREGTTISFFNRPGHFSVVDYLCALGRSQKALQEILKKLKAIKSRNDIERIDKDACAIVIQRVKAKEKNTSNMMRRQYIEYREHIVGTVKQHLRVKRKLKEEMDGIIDSENPRLLELQKEFRATPSYVDLTHILKEYIKLYKQ